MINETHLNNSKKINPIGGNQHIISELKSNPMNKGRNPSQFYIKRNPATSGEKTIFHSKNLSFVNINLCRPGQKKILHGIESMESNPSINCSNINKSMKVDESILGTHSSQSHLQNSKQSIQGHNYNTVIVNNLNNLNLNTHNYSFNTGASSICNTPVHQKINLNYNYAKPNQSNTSLLKGEGN